MKTATKKPTIRERFEFIYSYRFECSQDYIDRLKPMTDQILDDLEKAQNQNPTKWAYEQACKALHLYEDISKISITAMNKVFELAEFEKYDVPEQLKEMREFISVAINAITDMKVEFSKKENDV